MEITAEELQAIIKKAVQAEVGSQSVKGMQKNLPSLDISTKEQFFNAVKASGYVFARNLNYQNTPAKKSEKKDGMVGGYVSVSSSEKTGWNQKAKFWLKLAGLSAAVNVNTLADVIEKARNEEEMLKEALLDIQDLTQGLESLFNSMTENTDK